MKKWLYLLVNISLFTTSLATAQTTTTPFTAIWDFNNKTTAGVSSKPALISVSNLGSSNVTILGPVGGYPVSPGGNGFYANVQFWPTGNGACTGTDYVDFSVSPQIGAIDENSNIVKSISITEVSFLVSSSAQGPRSLVVTSSLNGFNINQPLYQTTLPQSGTPFTWDLLVSITGVPAFKNITTPVTFRIIACQASATTGTLRLDNININGDIMLPADLVAFTARADGRQVRLDWATSWERNTDRFVAEASTDLLQFRRVGEVASAGTTDQRQFYSLTDETPAPGPNYYRLLQIDRDGAVHYSRIISAIVQTTEPAIRITPNPANRQQISLTLPSTDSAELMVFDALGRSVAGRLVIQSGTDAVFIPDFPLAAGRYWLRLTTPGVNTGVAVLVP